jgi:hypothetical protein
VPSEGAEEYRVRVRMEAGPFKIDSSEESIIRASEIRG